MKKLIALLGAVLLVGAGLGSATAAPTAGGFTSENVEYIKSFPLHTDSAGAVLEGDFFYVTTERNLVIYDVSDPVNPVEVGSTLLIPPGQYYFPEEDPETNGKVLLVGNSGALQVYDVEDKTNPSLLGEVADADEHTVSCVLDCKWAYGSEGVIVDLRDPAAPKIAGNWTDFAPAKSTHDVTEVAPGYVMTSSQPAFLMDVRKDPTKPKVIAVLAQEGDPFNHSNIWPRGMKDRYLLMGGESSGPGCSEDASATFSTFDTKNWRQKKTFKMVDQYSAKEGVPTDGQMPTSTYCTHWFTTQPGYKNGGLVAIAWYEQGTRFLKIDSKGKISEVGYFLPYAGSTSAAYWVNDEIVYATDYNRGLDIIRFNAGAN